MSNITPFSYEGEEIRFFVNGAAIEIAATDLAKQLGHRDAANMTRHLDEDEKGTRVVSTPGGEQEIATVTEAGMYRAIVTRQTGRMTDESRRAAIRAFQRWVTHEVLPAIRRTGTYATTSPVPQPQLSEDEIVHQALQITARRVEQLEADLAKALPKANTWDALCSGRGDHSITDAAKLLSSAGIATGPRKLHKQLQDLGWIHKNQRDKWAANQDKLNTGLLAEKVRHYIDDDGVSVLATPQVRVTPKGLEKLRELLTPAGLQEVLA